MYIRKSEYSNNIHHVWHLHENKQKVSIIKHEFFKIGKLVLCAVSDGRRERNDIEKTRGRKGSPVKCKSSGLGRCIVAIFALRIL